MTSKHKKIYRVIDANFNRAKEGLRVCEDVCRFFYDKRSATQKYKKLRHDLTTAVAALGIKEIIGARAVARDVGRASSSSEFKRGNEKDIFYANSQRVKESIRVLEEFAKLIDVKVAEDLKKLRYDIYVLEKKVLI